jgi:DNA-binding CsgD family transcriptional regulator
MAANSPWNQLTVREQQVLELLARGQCNKMIAPHLGIAVGTIKSHVKSIMAKLEASSRTEAASIAAERGIVGVPQFRDRRFTSSTSNSIRSRKTARVTWNNFARA